MGRNPMTRGKHRLTVPQVRNAKTPGLLHDGAGLYLQIIPGVKEDAPRKSWLLRYQSPAGKRREMGLGSVEKVPLATARDLAEAARELAGKGIDPIEQRKADKAAAALEAAQALTFRQAAETYVSTHQKDWTNEKHKAQWGATLEAYAYPVLGPLPVAAIDVALVLRVLEPIWESKRETAARVRGRIEAILDWCAVRGYRAGENPARWRGHLQKALPKRTKTVRHHAALPFAEVAAFLGELRRQEGLGALALEFTILTAARSGEVLGAQWAEIDFKEALWVVPGERMKSGREHRVPLSRQALALLQALREADPKGKYVFAAPKAKAPLSNMAMAMTLRRLGRDTITVHGFRSTFRDWAGETTNFPADVAEAALAHVKGDKTELAYRRGDALAKRRQLMQAWGDFCDRAEQDDGAVVVDLPRKRRAGGS